MSEPPPDPPADDRSVDMPSAARQGLALGLGAMLGLVGLHAAVNGPSAVWAALAGFFGRVGVLVPALVAGVVVHEAVHGLAWAAAGWVPLRAMRFGVQWRALAPYCHCSRPIPAWAYRVGAAAPLVVVGVLPAVVGTAAGPPWLAAFGWYFTFVAGGDLLVLRLLRGVPGRAMVTDHPTRAGCLVVPTPAGAA